MALITVLPKFRLSSDATTWGEVRHLPHGDKRQRAPLNSMKMICTICSVVYGRGAEGESCPRAQGHQSSWDHDPFPPYFRFSPFFRKIFRLRKIFNFTFSIKKSSFSFAEISDDLFLVINHKFGISTYFSCFSTFPPCFAKIFISSEGNFHKFTFSKKNSSISCPEISDDLLLVINHKFEISPLFFLFQYISPSVSRIFLFPPYFDKFFAPVLDKFTCFLHTLLVFRLPPTLTMMHLCITQCTYWMPLPGAGLRGRQIGDQKSIFKAFS